MSRAKITYRFGTAKSLEEQNTPEQQTNHLPEKAPKVIPLYADEFETSPRDYGTWQSPFDIETERIERMIRESEATSTSGVSHSEPQSEYSGWSENMNRAFDRIPLYEDPARKVYRRKTTTPWMKMSTSVAGAVLTGLMIGIFVLNMFSGSEHSNESNSKVDQSALSDVKNQPAIGNETVGNDIMSIDLPDKQYYVLQTGVFSNEQSADNAIQSLKQSGMSGAIDDGDKYYVFVGLALEKADAQFMKEQLTNSGLEVYVKPYDLPAVSLMNWGSTDPSQVQTFIEDSRNLVDMMFGLTSEHLGEMKSTAFELASVQAVKSAHRTWTQEVTQLQSNVPEAGKHHLAKMTSALNSAIKLIDQYQKSPSNTYVWQIQAALTEHVIHQKQLLDALAS